MRTVSFFQLLVMENGSVLMLPWGLGMKKATSFNELYYKVFSGYRCV